MQTRCPWCESDPLYIRYHDQEWGVPCFDDRVLFEFLVLEGAQAGLSWLTILKRREAYRELFDGFDPERVARYSEEKIQALLADSRIIRNRLKIRSAVHNARAFLDVQASHGSFHRFIWDFVDGRPIQNAWVSLEDIPASTPLSEKISRALRHRGFSFVGPTIIYAHMQATGMVNDHLVGCFRYEAIRALGS